MHESCPGSHRPASPAGDCNYAIGNRHMLVRRRDCITYLDLATGSTHRLSGVRSGCLNPLIIADGVLSCVYSGVGCGCSYNMRTSISVIHMPELPVKREELLVKGAEGGPAPTAASTEPALRSSAGAKQGQDWPMWRCDAGRSGATDQELPAQVHLQWVRQYPAMEHMGSGCKDLSQAKWDSTVGFEAVYSPIVMGTTMFVGSSINDSLTAIDVATGEEKWRFFAGGPVRLAPAGWKGLHTDSQGAYLSGLGGFVYDGTDTIDGVVGGTDPAAGNATCYIAYTRYQ